MDDENANLRPGDIQILQDLYDATDGDNWAIPEAWEFSPDCNPCLQFLGVVCSNEVDQEGYKTLQYLLLSYYDLHGTIPESLYDLRNTSEIQLSNNRLFGTLSEKISQWSGIGILSIGDNYFSGTVPIGLSKLSVLDNLDLSTNMFTGQLKYAFDPAVQTQLANVQLHDNQFTGNIPDTLAEMKSLELLSLSWNCFDGTIPLGFCQSDLLYEMDMTGANMATSCRVPFINFQGSNSFLTTKQFSGGLPACLFEIESLTYLYMDGMAFDATLPADAKISYNLNKLIMSNNRLHGSIPHNFQDKWFQQLDLSYNRLNGVLMASISVPLTLSMIYNRLSNKIPNEIVKDDWSSRIEILEGNAFDCEADRSNLPHRDPYYLKYQNCGSSAFNITLYESVGLTVGCLMLVFVAFLARKASVSLSTSFDLLRSFKNLYKEHMADTTYYQWDMFVRRWVCVLTAVILVLLVPVYVTLSAYYATQTYKYAWVVSGVYLNGVVSSVCMLLVLLLLCGSVYWSLRRSGVSFAAEKSVSTMSECWSVTKAVWLIIVIALVLGDVISVVAVNTSYIAVSRIYSESTVQKVSVGMSIYKIVWNFLIVRNVLKVVTYKSPIRDFRIQQHWFTSLETGLVLFNNLMAPYIATLFVSNNCLQDAFVRNSQFAFMYSYQCSSTFITTYASVFLFMFALTAVGFPLIQGVLMWLHMMVYHRKTRNSAYFWLEKLFSIVQPKLLFPKIDVDEMIRMSGLDLVKDEQNLNEDYSLRRVLTKRLFCADLMVVDMVSMFAIMLTFGAVVPAVAFVGLFAVLSQSVFNELMIGRGIRKVDETYGGDAVKVGKFREELLLECRSYGDLFKLNIFICVPFVVVFYGLLLFDMVGDTEGAARAVWAPFVVLILVASLSLAGRYFEVVDPKKELRVSFEPLLPNDDSSEVKNYTACDDVNADVEVNPLL